MPVPHPSLRIGDDWRHLVVEESWVYTWRHEGELRSLIVPAGYATDGASVPKLLWWWISPLDLRAAFLPHDLIYGYAGAVPGHLFTVNGAPGGVWTRKQADQLFARVMREAGVPKTRRRAAYLAVRAFGWWPWRKARKRRQPSSSS